MIEQEWTKFINTGSIQDYLNYKCHQEAEGICRDTAAFMMSGRDCTGRSVREYGTDHSADGHGVIGGPGGRI
ncbi:MAG: hypothetical protein HFH48_08390 [Lachnospiraceae bacterium]|nr:hypothetical protein [Lachnospiraceae bacterium]